LDVLEKYDLEEMGFEENVDKSWSHLHNGNIKEEGSSNDGQIDIVIHSGKAVVLFVRQWLHQLFIYSLFEFSNIFGMVLKDLCQFWIITSFPFGIPNNFQHLILSYEIPMHVFEMKHICPILRYILNMTLDIVYRSASIRISSTKFLAIYHLKIGLHSWICMYPYINETVQFFCWVLTLLSVTAVFFPAGRLTLFASETITVFY
jgi:hypothetical protein